MISYSKIRVQIDLNAIRHNYRLLCRAGTQVIPVIKSDAYGHGLCQVAQSLAGEGADIFAVGYVHEGVQLRESGCQGRIISLLGPVDAGDYGALREADIIPFIGHAATLETLAATGDSPIDIALKFDTGMSRLGFREEQLPDLVEFLRSHPHIRPVMLSSHLAAADDPRSNALTDSQYETFSRILSGLREAGFSPESNLANSAAILGHEKCLCDYQRGGLALYGANPFCGTAWEHLGRDLQPAMDVTAPVLSVHPLEKGQGISYGHTFVADRDMLVAVVGVGYADCYSRGLSNEGWMNFKGCRVPIVGRVCMQMTCVDISGLEAQDLTVRVGDAIHLLGGPGAGRISPEDLAEWWGSITYEVLCLLGMNQRSFIES